MSVILMGVSPDLIMKLGEVSNELIAESVAQSQASEEMQVWAYSPDVIGEKGSMGRWRLWRSTPEGYIRQDVHNGPFISTASLFKWRQT